jgi:nicotinic acid mononucleotide adenylyltransferase
LDACEAEIVALEKKYEQSGGITQEEWNEKIGKLKEEEKKREVWNAVLRKWANEIVPFLIIRDQLQALKGQITAENDQKKYQSFCEILAVPEMAELAGESLDQMRSLASCLYGGEAEPILDLSFEQCVKLLAQISTITSFDSAKIEKHRNAIRNSINRAAKLREELDNSNLLAVQEYMRKRAELFERKSVFLDYRVNLEQEIAKQKEVLLQSRLELTRTQTKLEGDLKKASINDISAKAILMLDKLQSILYRQQISKVEDRFRVEIRTLMRKTKFIDDIKIDDDFNIFLFRNEVVLRSVLIDALQSNSEEQLASVIGADAIAKLKKISGTETMQELLNYCNSLQKDGVELPIRIDQASLSNGEKQIFIMALYHSLVQLGRHEIPFIIDTPFARIDTEHRHNISKYFFSKLKGQVFILSTNEEINSDHVQILRDHIAATYLLENTDNKKTVVVNDTYFEV